jgi:hypothetical protein
MTAAAELILLAAIPRPDSLRQLQTGLLAAGVGREDPVWPLLDGY